MKAAIVPLAGRTPVYAYIFSYREPLMAAWQKRSWCRLRSAQS
jgi:hypothetical protein